MLETHTPDPRLATASSDDADRHPLDLLAEEFAACCRRGERPSVSAYAERFPQYADQLRDMLPPIALMERLKVRNLSGSGGVTAPLVLERLGDFRVVRELGRGGMGIVYEATQESLGRHVALKVLSRASMLDPQRLDRFEREARAAAGLHHTNIVPVFGVGESEGLHYYVMQYIAGMSLAEVIGLLGPGPHPGTPSASKAGGTASHKSGAAAQTGTHVLRSGDAGDVPRGRAYWSWVAETGRQAASALDYAHRQGVLHRDVKPGNLLLDERGGVWVTDFGLAKLGESSTVTQSGDVIGTLQYLAPEALKSQADARSDVYGLAVTLYEMLTLRPAFEAPHAAALMRKVAEATPAAPRRINPQIPADLETIILKAMSRAPEARYATAGKFADDLENFLRDRPISARRITIAGRAWRWCRRNKPLAALSATAIVAALVAIVLGWAAYGVTRNALKAEATRRQEIEAEKKRADANVALSLQGFEELFNKLAPRDARPPPGPWGGRGEGPRRMNPERADQEAAVLGSILAFYDRFAKQNSTNDALQAEAAKAYRRVGDSYLRLERSDAADNAYRRSAALYLEMLKDDSSDVDFQLGLADAVTWLGAEKTPPEPADLALIHHAADLADKAVVDRELSRDQAAIAARILLRDGECLRVEMKAPAAEARFRRSIVAWGERPADPPAGSSRQPPPPRRGGGGSVALLALAELLSEQHRVEDAKRMVRDAYTALGEEPPMRFGESRLASAYERLSKVASSLGIADIAEQSRVQAEQIREFARLESQRPPAEGGPGRNPGRPDRERGSGRPGEEGRPQDEGRPGEEGPPGPRPPQRSGQP